MEHWSNYMPTLETPRLRLRKLTIRDAADIYAYSRDPIVAKYVLWDAMANVFEARNYIKYMIRKYRNGEPASWGIEWKATGQIIGTIGFMWIQKENASAEVGYSLSRPFWNKGIMTEALQATLRHGFHTLNLNRIEAQHETENPASGAVMRKCGMQREGILRQRMMNKGRFVDVELYAILRKEFNEQLAQAKPTVLRSKLFDPEKPVTRYTVDCSKCRKLDDLLEEMCNVLNLPDYLLTGSPWSCLNDCLIEMAREANRSISITFKDYTHFINEVLPEVWSSELTDTFAFVIEHVHEAYPAPQALEFIYA